MPTRTFAIELLDTVKLLYFLGSHQCPMQPYDQHRFLALDSMRGLCALIVAIYHFSCNSMINSLPFVKNGFLFVDFFFVLSGFVIAASYGDKLLSGFSTLKFMLLRLGRLYPLHIFILILYASIAVIRPGAYSGEDFLITALLLQIFTDGHLSNWNPPSWSISAEIWTYLLFAMLSLAGRRTLYIAAVGIVATAPFLLTQYSDRYLDVCFEGAIFRSSLGFFLGVICYFVWRRGSWRLISSGLFEAAALIASITVVSVAGAGPISFLCPYAFATAIYFLASQRGLVSRILLLPPLVAIGELSYSIYMTHLFVQARLLNALDLLMRHVGLPIEKMVGGQQTISNASGHMLPADVSVILMLAIVLALSAASHRFVEKPLRRVSRDLLLRTKPVPAPL